MHERLDGAVRMGGAAVLAHPAAESLPYQPPLPPRTVFWTQHRCCEHRCCVYPRRLRNWIIWSWYLGFRPLRYYRNCSRHARAASCLRHERESAAVSSVPPLQQRCNDAPAQAAALWEGGRHGFGAGPEWEG